MATQTAHSIPLSAVPKLFMETSGVAVRYQQVHGFAMSGLIPAQQNHLTHRWSVETANLPQIFDFLENRV